MKKLEQQVASMVKRSRKPMSLKQMSKHLKLDLQAQESLSTVLSQMEDKGSIYYYNGRYGTGKSFGLVAGKIVKVSETFGFATPLEEGEDDIFIPGRYLEGTLPGDEVLIRTGRDSRGGNLSEGRVLQVVVEVNAPFTALLEVGEKGALVVRPDSYVQFPFPVVRGAVVKGKAGDKVLARVTRRGKGHHGHEAEIIQVFGSGELASNNADAILAQHGIERAFPTPVLEQAKEIERQGIHPKEIASRLDLRGDNIFTLDGADTKDIDDAISLVALKDGWELGVHIADVSHYVLAGSPIDEEAYKRGTSVYFANQVLPMLPQELSNGICSLNPGEDRLAFSALLKLNNQGVLEHYRFDKTVITSRLQGVYSEVNEILTTENPSATLLEKYAQQLDTLKEMEKLAQLLRNNRFKRGAINLDSVESKITIGPDGKVLEISPRESGLGENMIEEFMLTANEAAATFGMAKKIPFIFRVHDAPSTDRLEALLQLLDSLGISYNRREKEAAIITEVLKEVEGKDIAEVINYSVLRTMAKAEYSSQNKGHFGLGLTNYTHFTSPIRRYPDMAIHRILSAFVTGMRHSNIENRFRDWVEPTSSHSTAREIGAMTAERDILDSYKAEYMGGFIGEEFEGVLSSATNFGIFVRLPNTVEGLIRSSGFPNGRWIYDGLITYNNQAGGAKLQVGDKIKIQVVSTSVPNGQIDFKFAAPELYASPTPVEFSFESKTATKAKKEPNKRESKNKRGFKGKSGKASKRGTKTGQKRRKTKG